MIHYTVPYVAVQFVYCFFSCVRLLWVALLLLCCILVIICGNCCLFLGSALMWIK